MIGKLKYLVQNRPDIALSIGIVAIFSTNPRENHLMVVKRIMRHLKGTKEYGLYYKKNEKFELRAYIDVDLAGNIDDRKSTSRGEFLLTRGWLHGLASNKTILHNLLLKLDMLMLL